MKKKRKSGMTSVRRMLSAEMIFNSIRLDVMLIDNDPKSPKNIHYKINPNLPYHDSPVIDGVTMGIVEGIIRITEKENDITVPSVFAAGHLSNGLPKYYTNTFRIPTAPVVNKLLRLISRDVLDDHACTSIHAYIRRLHLRTKADYELIKRMINGWAIANMILENPNRSISASDVTAELDTIHKQPDNWAVVY